MITTSRIPSLDQIRQELAKRNFKKFMLYDGEGLWQEAKHLDKITSILQSVSEDTARGKPRRVIVTLPPRHGKSECVSKKFPTWHEGKNPEHEIMLTSYSADLAYDHSRIARDTFLKHEGTFNRKLAKDSTAVGRWGVEGHRGAVFAGGVGGPMTGRGAHIAIVDDPFKNAVTAGSQTIRENVWNWYITTLYTRLAPGGSVIIVMTRWHEDDLVGRLLEKERENKKNGYESSAFIPWELIDFPAIAKENDVLGRKPGEALWPERYPIETLKEIQNTLGPYYWSALYQQSPSPDKGNIFERSWWQPYSVAPPVFDIVIQSWDCAFKDNKDSDYVVGQVWGKKGPHKYLLDQIREKLNFINTIQAIETMKGKWPQSRIILVEDKANGTAIINTLKNKIPGITPVTPIADKVSRARAVSPEVKAGNVFIPDEAEWVHDFINEHAAFPTAKNDDQVDATNQALWWFGETQSGGVDPTLASLLMGSKIYK